MATSMTERQLAPERVYWVDRRGVLGSLQEQAWFEQHGMACPDPARAIKAVLYSLDDQPAHITCIQCGEDGAPMLRDEIVTRAEVLCALSRLPRERRGLVETVYLRHWPKARAARFYKLTERELVCRLMLALSEMVPMVFDYTPEPPDDEPRP